MGCATPVRAARGPCQAGGLVAKVATLPNGEDPDDVVRSQGPAAIVRAAAAAPSMLEYLVDSILDRGFAADDAQARAAKIHEVALKFSADSILYCNST